MASARLSSLVEDGWIIELANLMLRKGVRGLEVEAEADGFGRFHRFLTYHSLGSLSYQPGLFILPCVAFLIP